MIEPIYQDIFFIFLTLFSLINREALVFRADIELLRLFPRASMQVDHNIYLPIVLSTPPAQPMNQPTRINLPYFDDAFRLREAAIHWFGEVRATDNYTDIRAGYTATELIIHLTTFDRHCWYDPTPENSSFSDWDAASVFLDITPTPISINNNSYRFDGQLNGWQDRIAYQAAYQGGNSGWIEAAIPFTTTSTMRGVSLNDNSSDDRGWTIEYRIPFSSLGYSAPPPQDSVWRLAIAVYDRDDEAGTNIDPKYWPRINQLDDPSHWGELHFGLPTYTPPNTSSLNSYTIRQNLNGITVVDAAVGGGTNCGDGLDFWSEWGETNYAYQTHQNIQNQADVADWPCFSKYYLTFPLDSLPDHQNVFSATLTLHQFGGSDPSQAFPSLIHVLVIGEDWQEETISWNNAPLPLENVSQSVVQPLLVFPGWPGVPRYWDLSRVVERTYRYNQSLRLVLYSSDGAYHSGKYFSTSDVEEWNEIARPTLHVTLGELISP